MTDELTDHGIRTDHPMVTLLDYVGYHGPPIYVDSERVIFADDTGNEIADWADALDMDRSGFHQRMHELARERYGRDEAEEPGDPWSTSDPVVFDAETFTDDAFQWMALLLRRGCSPPEAVDFYATEIRNWDQTKWAGWRRVNQQAVSKNVAQAREKLGDHQ